jgi:hypothetical protein
VRVRVEKPRRERGPTPPSEHALPELAITAHTTSSAYASCYLLGFVLDDGRLVSALREAGMTDVPAWFGIAAAHQEIPGAVLVDIDDFLRVFEHVTQRDAWRKAATEGAPVIARAERRETCFFSAWDFHVPPDRPEDWKLVEFNDNGSGFVFASLLNHFHHETCDVGRNRPIEEPADARSFAERIVSMMRAEAESFFGAPLRDGVLVLDDAESLQTSHFRGELRLLREMCRAAGWRAEIAAPEDTTWDGARLLCRGASFGFVVNRSTDFFFEGAGFAPLRDAYASNAVYVAPNPFTYATRSDKRLLEWMSTPDRDRELGILPEERAILTAHVPETHVLRAENVDDLSRVPTDWFFKPCHGFASHGLLPGAEVGRTRLRRLLKKEQAYVAQRRAPKLRIEATDGTSLWADLRVWAYRGERYLVSGRASRNPDRLDLAPPGGWLPTYAARSG